jgi:hypothetical protein
MVTFKRPPFIFDVPQRERPGTTIPGGKRSLYKQIKVTLTGAEWNVGMKMTGAPAPPDWDYIIGSRLKACDLGGTEFILDTDDFYSFVYKNGNPTETTFGSCVVEDFVLSDPPDEEHLSVFDPYYKVAEYSSGFHLRLEGIPIGRFVLPSSGYISWNLRLELFSDVGINGGCGLDWLWEIDDIMPFDATPLTIPFPSKNAFTSTPELKSSTISASLEIVPL